MKILSWELRKNGTATAYVHEPHDQESSHSGCAGTVVEFDHGNCGYHDGKQCRFGGNLSSIAGRLDQCARHSGIFRTGGRRRDRLCTVYRAEKQRKSKRICKTGVVYHNSYFGSSKSDLSCFPETTSQADLWFSRSEKL